MRNLRSILVFFILAFTFKSALAQSADTLSSTVELSDSMNKIDTKRRTPFIDSLLTDSLKNGILSKFSVHFPADKVPKVIDPLSPFNQKNFYISYHYKTWYMWLSLLIVVLFLLNRDVTPFGISMRFKALYNANAFEELLTNLKSNIGFSSLLSQVTVILVWTQFVVVIFILRGNHGAVNTLSFFSIVFALLSGFRLLIFLSSNIFSYSLNQLPFNRSVGFRQLNSDLLFSIPLFVFITFLYFSPFGLDWSTSIDIWLIYIFIFYYAFRFILSLTNNVQRGIPLFFIIAYFCAFEILPILLVIRIILNLL